MPHRHRSALFAAAALALLPLPAVAQTFSDSYQFLDAVRKADGAKVNEYLNKPGTRIIDTKSPDTGESALHIVAKRGDSTYLRFLLAKGADANARDRQGNTPMLVAVTQGFNEGVDILVKAKANIDLANSSGETPLIRAVQLRNVDAVRILLDGGADPDKADVVAGMSARAYATADARSPVIAKMLANAPHKERKAVAGPH